MEELITRQAEEFIRELFHRKIPEKLLYHDILHTEYVAGQAGLIGQHSGLNKEELNIVKVAAWFHDSGFVGCSEGHEEESQKIAKTFLSSKGVKETEIEKVMNCIRATKMPQNPGGDMLAQVVCDADMAYLSEGFYFERTNLLRKEWNSQSESKLTKKAYYQETIEMFNNHHYFTEYGKMVFSPGKADNLRMLHDLVGKQQKKGKDKSKKHKENMGSKKKSSAKGQLPGRGVESMFRLTARNQINLSSIADNKANILISINSIVLTVLLSIGAGKISDYPVITFPAIVFVATCLVTIVFAILSTRPKISSGKFTKEDIHNKKVNLLFFGNFYNMKLDEYEWAVKQMMDDSNYLYSSMIWDQYNLGKVISRKYKLLRVAYTVFMIGLILSSILFAVFVLFIS
jgi:predicted metal-dependent HD superfamily phosphohydrolase